MQQWLANFQEAVDNDMEHRAQVETRKWMFMTLGVIVMSAIALVAQLALFT